MPKPSTPSPSSSSSTSTGAKLNQKHKRCKERGSTCFPGAGAEAGGGWTGGVTKLRCYHGFKFHTQPGADLEPVRQRGDEATPHASSSSDMDGVKPPAWNACCRADKPRRGRKVAYQGVARTLPKKGLSWQVASFPPARPPPFLSSSDCNNCWRQICCPFPFFLCENCDL